MDINQIIADYGDWLIVAVFVFQAIMAIIDFMRGRKTKKQMIELNNLFSKNAAENAESGDDYLLQLSLRFCELLTEYYERNGEKKN